MMHKNAFAAKKYPQREMTNTKIVNLSIFPRLDQKEKEKREHKGRFA